MFILLLIHHRGKVAPRAGAWVEIIAISRSSFLPGVAPRAGAWVEINSRDILAATFMSLLVQERGLKYLGRQFLDRVAESLLVQERGLKCPTIVGECGVYDVAPRAGAWVEIGWRTACRLANAVAPRAGAWVEIRIMIVGRNALLSLLVQERGLKSEDQGAS